MPVIKLFNRDEGDIGDKSQETGIKEMERIIGIDRHLGNRYFNNLVLLKMSTCSPSMFP